MRQPRILHTFGLLALIAGAGVGLALSVAHLKLEPRPRHTAEIVFYLPPPAQLVSAAGDRYLAANVSVFRTFMEDTTRPLTPEGYSILANLHKDAAFLNPGHEDNYYVAAAILPWAGYVTETQYVLSRAIEGRPKDHLPGFLYAFNQRHFEKNPYAAAVTLRQTASRMPEGQNRLALEALSAAWFERSEGSNAAGLLRALAESTRNKAFAAYLARRANRLENMATIERAVQKWSEKVVNGTPPTMDLLLRGGYLSAMPTDPFFGQYAISQAGKVIVIEKGK